MKGTKNRVIKKLNSTLGMSLGEILVVVLILSLLTASLTTVMSLAVEQYNESMRASEANVLSSTLRSVISNELAYTTEIHTDASGNVNSFQSQNYTTESSLSTFIVSSADSGGFGKLLIGTDSSNMKLLGDGSYPRNLGAKIDSFTYDSSACCFTIKLSIGCKSNTYLEQTFQVLNVNKTTAKTS